MGVEGTRAPKCQLGCFCIIRVTGCSFEDVGVTNQTAYIADQMMLYAALTCTSSLLSASRRSRNAVSGVDLVGRASKNSLKHSRGMRYLSND